MHFLVSLLYQFGLKIFFMSKFDFEMAELINLLLHLQVLALNIDQINNQLINLSKIIASNILDFSFKCVNDLMKLSKLKILPKYFLL